MNLLHQQHNYNQPNITRSHGAGHELNSQGFNGAVKLLKHVNLGHTPPFLDGDTDVQIHIYISINQLQKAKLGTYILLLTLQFTG